MTEFGKSSRFSIPMNLFTDFFWDQFMFLMMILLISASMIIGALSSEIEGANPDEYPSSVYSAWYHQELR